MLPIGVLIPTRNCASLIPGHIESLRRWIDLAAEIVIVDSQSSDGTVELLRKNLSHPKVRFLEHPPGLYQSWNFGMQNLATKYVSIATVGDSITRAGVEHLFAVAEKFQSDVVISKPRFVSERGGELPDGRWPIDDIVGRLQVRTPRELSPDEQFFFALTNTWGAILGSSASNLYRTACLQERPFPTDFGTAGDGGWGMRHTFEVRMAVTPERFSTFRYHEKSYAPSEYHLDHFAVKMFRAGEETLARELKKSPQRRRQLEELRLTELPAVIERHLAHQRSLEECRKKKIPWIFQPAAWRCRRLRNESQNELNRLKDEIAAKFLAARA